MLTVKEINEVSFGKAGFSGYKPEDVDKFIDEVVESFTQLEAERDDAVRKSKELSGQISDLNSKNAELQEKITLLAKKVESYRAEEDGIKDVLFNAQKTARDTVQESKAQADQILSEARENARKMIDDAKVDASRAAEEYVVQANAKKDELEEIKRQVTAFRSSLLEMYKKHLECIDHIPAFKQKEKTDEVPAQESQNQAAPAEPVPEKKDPEPAAAVETSPAEPETAPPVEAPVQVPAAQPEPIALPAAPEPEKQPVQEKRFEVNIQEEDPPHSGFSRDHRRGDSFFQRRQQPSLRDKVDFTRDQARSDRSFSDSADLSEVGINTRAYSSIPESLRREKDSNFSHLEFGDDVDLGQKKKKR